MLSNEQLQALGFTTRSVYQGPSNLEMAAGLLQSLSIITKGMNDKPIFGRLVIVPQAEGFNIVEIVEAKNDLA